MGSFFRPVTLDAAIAVVVTAITEWNVWVFHTLPGPRWLTTPLPLLLALPLLWRRTHALLVLTLVMGAVVIQAVATGNSAEGIELMIAVGVAAYSAGAYNERPRALAGLAVITVSYAIYAAEDRNIESGRTGELWAGAFFGAGLLAAWLVGCFVRNGRERAALEATAAEREHAARGAVAEERSRLARELHDIVSHNLSVVVLQAGGARAQGDAADAGTLEKIERSSREALVEMRRLLGVLRENGDTAAALAPQPGIGELAELGATMRTAGLAVDLSVEGSRENLPAALELSVFRLVQEALTNTLKHAGSSSARVRVQCGPEAVTVDVTDDGGVALHDSIGSGHGLVGMRERVALFGGELDVGPRAEGGFAVHARFPLGQPS